MKISIEHHPVLSDGKHQWKITTLSISKPFSNEDNNDNINFLIFFKRERKTVEMKERNANDGLWIAGDERRIELNGFSFTSTGELWIKRERESD